MDPAKCPGLVYVSLNLGHLELVSVVTPNRCPGGIYDHPGKLAEKFHTGINEWIPIIEDTPTVTKINSNVESVTGSTARPTLTTTYQTKTHRTEARPNKSTSDLGSRLCREVDKPTEEGCAIANGSSF